MKEKTCPSYRLPTAFGTACCPGVLSSAGLSTVVVTDPIFWLGLSFLLVSVSLTAVLVVLLPTVRELSRAARSVEKLCDTLNRELPPTLESIRLTSLEITGLTDDVTDGVHRASRVAQQVDHSVSNVRQQAHRVQISTRSLVVGVRAAWKTLTRPQPRDRRRPALGAYPRPSVPDASPLATRNGSPTVSDPEARPRGPDQSPSALSEGANTPYASSSQAPDSPPTSP